MSLSPFVSFQSRFVTYLLTYPRSLRVPLHIITVEWTSYSQLFATVTKFPRLLFSLLDTTSYLTENEDL